MTIPKIQKLLHVSIIATFQEWTKIQVLLLLQFKKNKFKQINISVIRMQVFFIVILTKSHYWF